MEKQNKIVAIYIRVSTLDQVKEGYSLDVQEKTLRNWCNTRNYKIFDLYSDKGISGKCQKEFWLIIIQIYISFYSLCTDITFICDI